MTFTEGIAGPSDHKRARYCDELGCLACGFAACQFVLHCWAAALARDRSTALMHVIAFLYDLFLLLGTAWILQVVGRLVPESWVRAFRVTANTVVFALGMALACYPLLLTDFLTFPMNIFGVGDSMVGFFLANLLGWRGVLALVGTGTVAVLSLRQSLRIPVPRSKWLLRALTFVCLLGLLPNVAGWPFLQILPHPLVFSVEDFVKHMIFGERVVPQLALPTTPSADSVAFVAPPPLAGAEEFRYSHVFLLVMETVNEVDFARGFLGREGGFYARLKGQVAYFSRYYTTNLDSYTSLLAMLTSVQVPYRAYARPDYYAAVNDAPNMVRTLGATGWESLFVCTALHQPFVPLREQWSVVLHGHDLGNSQRWAAVETNAVEAAVEDRAALPSMIAFAGAHERTLVMHEIVFGHSSRWAALTGKSQLRYYDDLFQELYDGLAAAGLADTSLFIVVADHGSRANCALPENYHVPLLIVGKGVEPSFNGSMYSHLDLQQIVGHYLCDLPLPEPRDDVLVVGHSARWVYGQITRHEESLFIDALDGAVLAEHGGLTPQNVFTGFQGLVDSFAHYLRIP